VKNPHDLVDRQNDLLKGIEVKLPPNSYDIDPEDEENANSENVDNNNSTRENVPKANENRKDDFRLSSNWV
jgi:hypothetical protein